MNKLTAEKCREQFEDAWVADNSSNEEEAEVRREALRRIWLENEDGGTYLDSFVMWAWKWWKASRAALPILEQQERGEGEWIEWGGGDCPVGNLFSDTDFVIEVKFRTGNTQRIARADFYSWDHYQRPTDIIAYRVILERATNQNGEQ